MTALDAKSLFSVGPGKNILVTGGGRGIGQMMAEAFVRAGNNVWICSRDSKACDAVAAELNAIASSSNSGGSCKALSFDLSKIAGCNELAAAMPEQLHVLVNNSGMTWGEPLHKFSEKGWDRVMDLNVKGLFFLTKALLPKLKAAGTNADPARLINIGSIAGLSPQPAVPTYSYDLSKKAVHYLTEKLSGELAPQNITCNAIAPGIVPTKMGAMLGPEEKLVRLIPMGRLGKPSDMAGIALFLASPAASWITGAIIPVDGGQVNYRGPPLKSKL